MKKPLDVMIRSLLFCSIWFLFIPKTILGQSNSFNSFDLLLQNVRIEEHKQIEGDYLRSLHSTNLLKAIEMAEPSLRKLTSNDASGDNPNLQSLDLSLGIASVMPLEGRTTEVLPLLVIDGYLSNLRHLSDFDMGRVDKVYILDKANALALYGLKGANGAIYIKTIPMSMSGLVVNYRSDIAVNFADLSSYSLMSYKEKLSFEQYRGYYISNQELYDQRNQNDFAANNWLKKGVRAGIVNKHSVDVEGGDSLVKFRISLLAQPANSGVMHGVKNDNYGVGAQLSYKSKKFFLSNNLRVDLVNGEYVPNVSLLDYAMINPYFKEKNSVGFLLPLLGEGSFNPIHSPKYEENINSFSKSSKRYVNNTLTVRYNVCKNINLEGSITYFKNFDKRDQFVSHLSKSYFEVSDEMIPYRGKYDIIRANQTTFEEKALLSYNRNINKHRINSIVGIAGYNSKTYADNYAAIGFPNTSMSYISFANQYAFGSKPGGTEFSDRMLSEYLNVSYGYDNRYYAEINARVDNSSALFTRSRSYLSYSALLSWDISNEKWFSNKYISRFKLTSSYGRSGYIDFNYSDVHTMYNYLIDDPYLDFASSSPIGLVSLNRVSVGNRNLRPRQLNSFYASASFSFMDIADVWIDYNRNLSSDLLSIERRATVEGIDREIVNGGEVQNSGFQMGLNAKIINKKDTKLNIVFNMVTSKNKINKIGEFHQELYNNVVESNLADFHSQGTQPVLLNVNSSLHGIYTMRNGGLQYIADSSPKLSGNMAIRGVYKKWNLGVLLNYSFGQYMYNMTRDYRIDNGDARYNLPKEAFNRIEMPNVNMPLSEYVEKNDMIKLSSLDLSYSINKLVKTGFIVNNLFTYTSKSYERGWVYPYVKTFNLFIKVSL